MPSERSVSATVDIIHNAMLALDFMGELDEQAFASDLKTFYATTRCLEIISEAARRLDPEVRERYANLPWRLMFSAGNVYRHEYDDVLPSFVWVVVRKDIPPLTKAMRQELARDG